MFTEWQSHIQFLCNPTDDLLQCDACQNSSKPPGFSSPEKGIQHLYTHPLVKCKARVVIPKEPSELDRIIALSKRNDETEKKLDDLVSNIQNLDIKLGAVSGLDSKVDRILQLISSGRYGCRVGFSHRVGHGSVSPSVSKRVCK